MHRIKNKLMKKHSIKSFAVLICTLLVSMFTIGSTYALVITDTQPLVNKFVNGTNPTGNLVIHKQVTHPFGDSYIMPAINFSFDVNLGTAYANTVVKTTQGDKTANADGVINITVPSGGRTTVFDINKDTNAVVTETNILPGFTPVNTTANIVIQPFVDNNVNFVNDYLPEKVNTTDQPATLVLKGEKKLEGRHWAEGDSFTFQLEVNENNRWKLLDTQTVTYELVDRPDPENAENTIKVPKENFDKFDFTSAIQSYSFDTAGTYFFRVTELPGTLGGVDYDKTESLFEIIVGDADMDGWLEIQSITTVSDNVAIENSSVFVVFSNKYAPAGSAQVYINIEKTLQDKSGQNKAPSGFIFDLFDENGALVKTSAPTDSTGKTSIKMVYEPAQADNEYTYILKETNAGQTVGAVKYDTTEYKVKVTVQDNLDGTVSAFIADAPEELPPQETPEQENPTPETPAPETPETEIPENPAENQPQEEIPTETLAESNTAEIPAENSETMPVAETPQETSQPTESEPPVQETQPVESPAAEEVQTVEADNEENSIETILTMDNSSEENLLVENPGQTGTGAPEPEPNPEDAGTVLPPAAELTDTYTAQFVNTYDPQDTSVSIQGKKYISGRDLKDKEFSFYLFRLDDNLEIVSAQGPVETVKNAADGTVSFTPLLFDKVGTYYYAVFENVDEIIPGVTPDYVLYIVKITVKDNNGMLENTVYVTDANGQEKAIEFHNTYKASPAYLSMKGKKVLTGARLTGDDFFFQLYAADETFNITGNVLKTAANNADGDFEFKDICFETAGIYRFVVKEDTSKEKAGITFDTGSYCITAEVIDPGNGQLAISNLGITKSGEAVTDIVFENTYTVPVVPDQPDIPDTPDKPDAPYVPDTGDNTNVMVYAGAFTGAVIAMVIVLVFKRKKNDEE